MITHYDALGVAPTAGDGEIRSAYRRLARVRHPDRGGGDERAMAALNEAYRVLSDPARRERYDHQLLADAARSSSAVPAAARATTAAPTVRVRPPDTGPARFPWRLAALMAAGGAIVVLIGAALYEPGATPPPDNILEPGSCVVVVESDRSAREAPCDESAELVVRELVPIGDPCPSGTAGYRDRQGRGTACIEPRTPSG